MMRIAQRCRTGLCIASTLLLAGGLARPCRAQVVALEIEERHAPDAQEPAGDGEDAEQAQAQAVPRAVFLLSDEQFDQWVYGGLDGGGAGAGRGARRLDSLLTLQVDDVARVCGLSDPQRRKLLLAGRGDIKRFSDRVAQKRKKFVMVRHDQSRIGAILLEIQPLQMALSRGLFGDESFFSKSLRRVLSAEQAARYQQAVRDRDLFRYRAQVELAVAQLDSRIGLRDEQRRALMEILLNETRPPRHHGEYDQLLILYRLRSLPVARLEPLFNDRQWAFLNRQLNQAKNLEPFLRQRGLLPERDEAGPPAGPVLPDHVFAPAVLGD